MIKINFVLLKAKKRVKYMGIEGDQNLGGEHT